MPSECFGSFLTQALASAAGRRSTLSSPLSVPFFSTPPTDSGPPLVLVRRRLRPRLELSPLRLPMFSFPLLRGFRRPLSSLSPSPPPPPPFRRTDLCRPPASFLFPFAVDLHPSIQLAPSAIGVVDAEAFGGVIRRSLAGKVPVLGTDKYVAGSIEILAKALLLRGAGQTTTKAQVGRRREEEEGDGEERREEGTKRGGGEAAKAEAMERWGSKRSSKDAERGRANGRRRDGSAGGCMTPLHRGGEH